MNFYNNEITKILGIKYPIFQAPMAGGITTVELISETCNNGAIGNMGAGYMDPKEMLEDINKIQSLTRKPFGVNLFIPARMSSVKQQEIQAMISILSNFSESNYRGFMNDKEKEYEKLFYEQVEILLQAKVPLCSFTFGIPDEQIIKELKQNGSIVAGTATNVKEAIELEQAGVDLIVAQGVEAGGHRGTFHPESTGLIGLISLIPQISDHVRIPVIAAGGIMDGRGIAASVLLGAQGVQLGTAFLTCKESGAHPIYKEAILHSTEEQTVFTKSFSGKLARGIQNIFINEMEKYSEQLLPFPFQNDLTAPLRKQAGIEQNKEFMSLWAGQGIRMAKNTTVASLLQSLVDQFDKIIKQQ